MTTYYDDTAKAYAERAEAAAALASQSKQQASTAATTATTQANIAVNAASNAATLVKSELQSSVNQMKQDALAAATNASASATSASTDAVAASNSAIAAQQAADRAMTNTPVVLSGPPTTGTQATLGKLGLWHDAANDANHLYHLAYITTSDNLTSYHWEECVLVSNAGQAGGVVTIGQDGKISASILPLPGSSTLGGVAVSSTGANGVSASNTGVLGVVKASNAEIDAMADDYKAIVPSNLDYAVAAALSGTNHMTLSAAQQAVAQEVLGVTGGGGGGGPEPLTGHGAPTGSTEAVYGQLYKDVDTGRIYLCINAVTQNSATTTTWLELVLSDQKGAANGVASLGSDGKVPSAQLPTIPTQLSQLTEDTTHRVVTDAEKTAWNGKSDFSGSYNDLSNKPTIPTALSQLTDDATHRLVTDTEKTAWDSKSDFSGSYTDLSNKPTIPTALSQLTDDSTHRLVTDTEKTAWDNKSNFSGSYTDLTNKPSIPSTAADVGAIPATDKGANNGVATLDGDGKLTASQLPVIHGSGSPTTSTAGVIGQTYSDDAAGKTYTCVSIGWTEQEPQYNWQEVVYASMKNVANGVAGLDSDSKVPRGNLPIVGDNSNSLGVFWSQANYGLSIFAGGAVRVTGATISEINAKASQHKPITPFTIDYSVRSVLPNVTEIPAATSDYSLVDSSATTNNHSHVYTHVPTTAPTYRLPAVTDTTIVHYIELTVDFTTVQTYSFLDSNGDAVTPLFTPTVSAGDVYTFKCEYSTVKSAWLIYPQKQGATSSDFVMKSEVGVANGVAPLDSNSLVPLDHLKKLSSASTTGYGLVMVVVNGSNGIKVSQSGYLITVPASNAEITSRTGSNTVISPTHLNHAVTAALTDANHITLTALQQAVAKEVLGIQDSGGVEPTMGSGAPTSSTVGQYGQLYKDTVTSRMYLCVNVTADETDPNDVVMSYTWLELILSDQKGVANGVASLGSDGKVPSAQLPTIPTALSQLTDDSTHRVVTDSDITSWNGKSTFSGSYTDLTDKPTIPTALSQLTDDSTHRVVTDTEKTTWNGKSNFSGSYTDLTDKPTIPSTASDVGAIPATDKGAANGVASLDSSGKVTSSQLPTIPTALSQLTDDSTHRLVTDTEKTTWNNKSNFSGSYADLTNKPTIPSTAADVGAIPATDKGAVNGVAGLGSDGKVPSGQLPAIPPAPLVMNSAPTTATVGSLGQVAIDTTYAAAYKCISVDVDETDPQNPVTTYRWAEELNSAGGIIRDSGIGFYVTYPGITSYIDALNLMIGPNSYVPNTAWYSAIVGEGCTLGADHTCCIMVGAGLQTGNAFQFVQGVYNASVVNAFRIVGAGASSANRMNVEELSTTGNHYIAGGHQQKVTTIPAATSSYTLSEGVYVHTPQTASLYTLPAVSDGTRTHVCVVTIVFSANVLTYEFQDSNGVTQQPMPLYGTIEPGAVVTFLCRYNPVVLLWSIFPVLEGVIVSP